MLSKDADVAEILSEATGVVFYLPRLLCALVKPAPTA